MKFLHINRDILVGGGSANVAKKLTFKNTNDLTKEEAIGEIQELIEMAVCDERYKNKIERLDSNVKHLIIGICIGVILTTLFAYVL